MSDGQLDITVDGTIRGDEVGLMAKSVEVFRVNGLEARRVAAEAEAARQAEDRRVREQEARDRAAAEAEHQRELAAKQAEERRQREADAAE
ncbi:hypothetical protein ABTM75_19100, partial [Acinetobacter baumannii]